MSMLVRVLETRQAREATQRSGPQQYYFYFYYYHICTLNQPGQPGESCIILTTWGARISNARGTSWTSSGPLVSEYAIVQTLGVVILHTGVLVQQRKHRTSILDFLLQLGPVSPFGCTLDLYGFKALLGNFLQGLRFHLVNFCQKPPTFTFLQPPPEALPPLEDDPGKQMTSISSFVLSSLT